MRRDSVKITAFCWSVAAPCACWASAAAAKPRRRAVSRTSPFEFLTIDLASAWNSRSSRHLAPQLGELLGRERARSGLALRRRPRSSHSSASSSSSSQSSGSSSGRRIDGRRGCGRGFEPLDQAVERAGDGVGRRREQLAQDERHELALAGRQGVERRPLQVVRDQIVEPLLVVGRHELLHERVAVRVLDVLEHLPAERALADRLRAAPSARRSRRRCRAV